MPVYKTPDNLVELLNGVVRSASRTAFYRPRLSGVTEIATLDEFRAIPPTPLAEFRDRALRDTLAEPSNVDWIVGADGGQSPARAAMVENADEGAIRYDVLADAVKEQVDLDASTVCVAVSTPERRYFASEVATILIAAGAHAHVFTDEDDPGRMNDSNCWVRRSWSCSHHDLSEDVSAVKRTSWQSRSTGSTA